MSVRKHTNVSPKEENGVNKKVNKQTNVSPIFQGRQTTRCIGCKLGRCVHCHSCVSSKICLMSRCRHINHISILHPHEEH